MANGPGPCATSDLKVSTGGAQGAAGSVYLNIDFRNISSMTCTLYGYPGVSLVNSSHEQVGRAAARSSTVTKKLITLTPGGSAAVATLQIAEAGNYPSGTCGPTPVSYIKVYPPNQRAAVDLPYDGQGCSKTSVGLLFIDAVS